MKPITDVSQLPADHPLIIQERKAVAAFIDQLGNKLKNELMKGQEQQTTAGNRVIPRSYKQEIKKMQKKRKHEMYAEDYICVSDPDDEMEPIYRLK